MEIQRDGLMNEFKAFEREGDGVLIGAPGVGKTHLLRTYCRAAHTTNRPIVPLALDKHSIRNDRELQTELELERDLVDTLASDDRATPYSPGLLAIDSYDALRSEEDQRYVRALIRRAQSALGARWRIIVAVRTFDASRSRTLLDLFPDNGCAPPAEFQMARVLCRHFVVPLLTDDETRQAVKTVQGLDRIYERGSLDFQELLHSPFNLWLAETLLVAGVDPMALSAVSSEVQLLSLFWAERVETGPMSLRRRSVLTGIAGAMVEARQLSLRQDAHYRQEDDSAWRDLLSSGVLTEVGTARQRVAFGHNILFDFAVSLLLIDDEPAQVAAFLAAEPARPVFLRPSINYYLTRLWFQDRNVFWTVAWFLLTHERADLRLFGRLIPMAVVVREARGVEDLAPVIDAVDREEDAVADAVLRLLQARRALRVGNEEMWFLAFEHLLGRLHRRFTWELTVQTFDGITSDLPPAVLASAGRIGRTVLGFTWALRDREAWADSLASSWATRLVTKTYCTDAEQSRRLLSEILESFGDGSLSVAYVQHIARNIDAIWHCDPAFVAEIYEQVFGHRETSTDATDMGTPVLPIRSNRRQDFYMCVYVLNQHYGDFLEASEEYAIRGGIAAVDRFVERDHVMRYMAAGHRIEELTERFAFGEREALYVRDGSEIWRAGTHQDEKLKIADAIIGYLESAGADGHRRCVDLALRLLVEHARMAFWWAEVLAVGARHAELFAARLYPLCVARPVLVGSATVKQVADFVAAAYPFWRREQRRSLELAVCDVSRVDGDGDWAAERRERVLGLVPAGLLVTDNARQVRAEMVAAGRRPRNEPLAQVSVVSRSIDETDWLREQGADVERSANRHLREVSAVLEAFENAWRNGMPANAAVTEILPTIEQANELLREDGADRPVVEMVRTRIATTAMIAARTATPADRSFAAIRSILLDAAAEAAVGDIEPMNEEREDAAWSPRPETEAAQGLPWLGRRQQDRETLQAIESLVRSPDAIIRYLVVRELFRMSDVAASWYWRLIDERIADDNAPIVRVAVCESLARVAGGQPGRVADAARRLWRVVPRDPSKRSDFRDRLLEIVIWLRSERNDTWARGALDELVRAPMSNPSLFHAAVLGLWHKVLPSRLAEDRAAIEDGVAFELEAIRQTCRVLGQKTRADEEHDGDELKDLYGVIHESVAHVYFCLSREHGRDGDATDEARRDFFCSVVPILDEILDFGLDRGFVLAPTVHHFMELLNEVVELEPRRAVIMAARAARAGESTQYNIDSLAIGTVVQLVEHILADHREEVQDGEALKALMDLLDVFAATGWPEAMQLVWRLDDLFR